MSTCQSLTSIGKPCTRPVSNKTDYDPKFCWQHQGIQPKTITTPKLAPTSTHEFKMVSDQMLVGDIGYAYDDTGVDWRTLEDLSIVLSGVKTGDWTFNLYGDFNKMDMESEAIWLLLSAKGLSDYKTCKWESMGETSTDAAMIGFFDNRVIRGLDQPTLKMMAEDASSKNVFPFGVYLSTASDGTYTVDVCRNPDSKKITAVRVVLMAEEDFDPDSAVKSV